MFTIHTEYNAKNLAVLAKALRRTLRKKKNRRTHIFGWIVCAVAVLLILDDFWHDTVMLHTAFIGAAAAIMVLTLLFEDKINGYFASKRLLPITATGDTTFEQDSYTSVSPAGQTTWKYENIVALCESEQYFVFVVGKSHGQLFDKATLQGGSEQEFRDFICSRCSCEIVKI